MFSNSVNVRVFESFECCEFGLDENSYTMLSLKRTFFRKVHEQNVLIVAELVDLSSDLQFSTLTHLYFRKDDDIGRPRQ